ncbi:MAG: PadR family transcriptional regulator [Candidatus Zophobacter franzmannii]|jgi:PadR family transcriptional regulator PadR|nr:PadR family transcriptional regulator [Candidatus Zophobacter franzmannii]
MKLYKNVEKTLESWEKEFKKGLTAYMILLLLKKDKKYGYELKQELFHATEDKLDYNESAIYQILKKMTAKGFITSEWGVAEKGPKRKYYILTDSGRQLSFEFTKKVIIPMRKSLEKLIPTGRNNE